MSETHDEALCGYQRALDAGDWDAARSWARLVGKGAASSLEARLREVERWIEDVKKLERERDALAAELERVRADHSQRQTRLLQEVNRAERRADPDRPKWGKVGQKVGKSGRRKAAPGLGKSCDRSGTEEVSGGR